MTTIDWSLKESRPGAIFGVRRNYGRAVTADALPDNEPWLYLKPPGAVIASGGTIPVPRGIEHVVAEGEIALLIGEKARHVKAADAHHCVRGVLCANDVTAIDLFRPKVDGGLVLAKGLDGFCPLGGDIAPFDVLESGVMLKSYVNGKLQGKGNTRDMTFSARTVIAFVTRWFTLSPGDVILLGTPGACRIQPGDEVRIEAQGIGSVANKVIWQ